MTLPPTIPILGWRWDDLLFLAFAAIMLGSALLVVLGRDIIRSGLWMIFSFAALAGIYVLLGAALVGAAQVLVYIGAISVLVLFAIMLTQTKVGPARLVFHPQAALAGFAVVVLALVLVFAVSGTDWPQATTPGGATRTDDLARLLFDRYVLAFEVVSVLLLAAVVGGVFLAKQEDEPQTIVQQRPAGEPEAGP